MGADLKSLVLNKQNQLSFVLDLLLLAQKHILMNSCQTTKNIPYIIIIMSHVSIQKNDLWRNIQRVKACKKYFLIAIMVYKVASCVFTFFLEDFDVFSSKPLKLIILLPKKRKQSVIEAFLNIVCFAPIHLH